VTDPAPAASPARLFARRLWIEAALVSALVFVIDAWGACRTIYVGDSGELVAAVGVLGIPHPSGYPLYVLLGKLWTLLLPIGSIALRMSLFSAACTAAACGVLHHLLRRLGLHPAASAMAALLLALSPSVWGEANVQRVYALNLLFVVMVVAAAFAWRRTGEDRMLLLACFLCGLGATNHTVMGLVSFAVGVFALVTRPGLLRRPWLLVAMPAAAIVGLLPYAYLPLRSRMDPPLDWGNPETFSAFMNVVLRRDFWNRAWAEGPADAIPIAADYFSSIGHELLIAGAALAVVGVIAARRRGPLRMAGHLPGAGPLRMAGHLPGAGWPVLLPLLVMAVNALAVGLHGSRSDIFIWHRYYIPSYAMAALLAGLGAQAVLERALPRLAAHGGFEASGSPAVASAGADAAGRGVAAGGGSDTTRRRRRADDRKESRDGRARASLRWAWVLLALPAVGLVLHWREFDRSRYRIADDFSRKLLQTLPPGAHLSASDDNILFVLIYLRLVEGLRPDVDLILQGVGGADLPPLRFNPDSEGLYFTHHPNWDTPKLRLVPVGLVFRVMRAGAEPPPAIVPSSPLEGADDPSVPKDYLTQNLIGQWHYMLGCTFERGDWPRAFAEYQTAARVAPDNDVLFYNLGLIYSGHGLMSEALAAFERSDAINPRAIASHEKVRALTKVELLRAEVERLRAIEDRLSAGLPPVGTVEYHRALAERLRSVGEEQAANGHRLRALVAGRGASSARPSA
jgi:tetratricopeptide (TPR) repeat protein